MITKRPWEEIFRTLQFLRPDGGGPLTDGETLTSATVTATALSDGSDHSVEMIADVSIYATTQVRYRLKGGSTGNDYQLTVRAETSNGQKFEERLGCKVN